MPFLQQKFFFDSLNYFCQMVSFAREMLDLRKKMWIYQKRRQLPVLLKIVHRYIFE